MKTMFNMQLFSNNLVNLIIIFILCFLIIAGMVIREWKKLIFKIQVQSEFNRNVMSSLDAIQLQIKDINSELDSLSLKLNNIQKEMIMQNGR